MRGHKKLHTPGPDPNRSCLTKSRTRLRPEILLRLVEIQSAKQVAQSPQRDCVGLLRVTGKQNDLTAQRDRR